MNPKKHKWAIGIISVIVPLIVAFLIFSPGQTDYTGDSWVRFLPHLNGIINTATSLILVAGFFFIRKGNKELHKTAMVSAFILGAIFLISYIIYHSSAPSTVFGDIDHDGVLSETESDDAGNSRVIYLGILLSHIALAVVVVPLVLFALYFALTGQFVRHRKVVKFAFPVWLYVSVTGVVVYLMISQYY